MTQKAAIVLADSALTPESPGTPAAANRTFVPGAMEDGYIHTFYNETTGLTPALKTRMTCSISPATTNKPVTRVKLGMALPKAQTVDGLVQAAHVNRGFVEFVFDKDSTRDDRRDLKTLLGAMYGSTEFQAMISELEDLW